MNKDRINEVLSIALGIMSVFAIIGLLINNNFDTNELLGSIVNFTQVAIPVLVLIGIKFFSDRSYSFLDAGKSALIKLQGKYKNDIDGPKANSQKTDNTEESDKRNKYLFLKIKNIKLKTKVTFIPMNDLEDGIIDIRVSKGTLVNKNMEGTDAEIADLQSKVSNAIKDLVTKKIKPEHYEIVAEKKSNSAIIIDFAERELGTKKFEKIVFECGETAFKIITSYK
jgi:hypothetical protein